MKDKLLFVHIPKAGGTSVSETLAHTPEYKSRLAISPYPRKRDHVVVSENVIQTPDGRSGRQQDLMRRKHATLVEYSDFYNLSEYFIFSMVRNPFTRIYSHYKQYQIRSEYLHPLENFLEFINKTRPIVEERANQRPCKLLDEDYMFAASLHEYKETKIPGTNKIRRVGDSTPFIFFTESYYLKNESNKIQADKIYKIENREEFENDFNVKLIKINVNRGNYTKEDYYREFTPTAIDMVRKMYSEDFENFGYSTEFV